MRTRSEALTYALTFPDTYQQAPFHDPNWQLVRVKGSKKAFLWTYEKDGFINLHPSYRDGTRIKTTGIPSFSTAPFRMMRLKI